MTQRVVLADSGGVVLLQLPLWPSRESDRDRRRARKRRQRIRQREADLRSGAHRCIRCQAPVYRTSRNVYPRACRVCYRAHRAEVDAMLAVGRDGLDQVCPRCGARTVAQVAGGVCVDWCGGCRLEWVVSPHYIGPCASR